MVGLGVDRRTTQKSFLMEKLDLIFAKVRKAFQVERTAYVKVWRPERT